MDEHSSSLIVAVGPDGSGSALRFAVDYAAQSGLDLHLVHALHLSGGEPFPTTYAQAAAEAGDVLSRAAAKVTQQNAEMAVTTELVEEGTVVSNLVERSSSSQGVVLEHRRLPRLRRFLTGSVVNGVASRAVAPVVSVPQDWRPVAISPALVTVAAQDAEEARGLLAFAGVLARQREAELVLLHTWWMGNGYDTLMEDESTVRNRRDRIRDQLQEALDEADLEGVSARLRMVHRPPVDALVGASADSNVLVVGRRHHLLPLGTHLGPVARGVIDHARCPVVLAPESPSARSTAR